MHVNTKESNSNRIGRMGTLRRLTVAYIALPLLLSGAFLLTRQHFARVMLSEAAHTMHRTPFGPVTSTRDEELLKLDRQFIAGMIVITCGFLAFSRLLWKGEKITFAAGTQLIAIGLLVELFIRAFADVDISADSWGYHLPFAARLWGIAGRDSYRFNSNLEAVYSGFPHSIEFIQGLFWKLSGRVQAANFVCLLSLVLFCFISKAVLKVRWQYVMLALIAIPLVQIHATSDYVDLPVNLCVATLIIICYKWFVEVRRVTNLEFSLALFAAILAANGKFQMVLISIVLFSAIFWARVSRGTEFRTVLAKPGRTAAILSIWAACIVLVGFTPLKNCIIHGNPFFPVKITLLGNNLPYAGEQQAGYTFSTQRFDVAANAARWVSSVFELKNEPFSWSIDQWNSQADVSRTGGFFGAFMAANLLLLVGKLIFKPGAKLWRERFFWFLFIFLTASAPRSLELRYYMYFSIVLVTLNLYSISQMVLPERVVGLAEKAWMSVVLGFLVVVLAGTHLTYIRPHFYGMQRFLTDEVDPRAMAEIKEGGSYTVTNAYWPFLYCAKFHDRGHYSVRAVSAGDGPPTKPVEITAVGSIWQ